MVAELEYHAGSSLKTRQSATSTSGATCTVYKILLSFSVILDHVRVFVEYVMLEGAFWYQVHVVMF